MKRFIPLIASLMILASCGGGSQGGSQNPGASSNPPQQTSSQQGASHKLTFIEDGEIYIDFNFDNPPAGLSIKIGDSTLTAAGKAKMSKDFTYEVKGTFAASMNIYYAIDTGEARSAGKFEGIDAEVLQERIGRYISNFASKQYEYRIYFCLSDKTNGWSKTLAGVDETIKEFAGSQQAN